MTGGARRQALLAAALVWWAPGPAGAREIDCAALLGHIRTVPSLLEKRKLLESAAEKCPRDAAVAHDYAFALERLRSYPEALRQYRLAAELDPRNGKAHIGVGDVLMLLGDTAGAVAAYDRGLALDTGNERAKKALELARIKLRAQKGEDITSDEFVRVMTEAEHKVGPAESAEGPLLRMQIHFRTGSATLDGTAVGRLGVVGKALKSKALSTARVEIAGHTDDVGEPEANLALSRRRAEQVRDHLAGKVGVPAGRLAVSAFGQSRPIAGNDSAEGRAQNRRVEFRLLR